MAIMDISVAVTQVYISRKLLLLLADDSEAGTAYPSRAGKFNPGFSGVTSYCSILNFHCSALQIIVCSFIFFTLANVISVLK
jgi:hypothetical protein